MIRKPRTSVRQLYKINILYNLGEAKTTETKIMVLRNSNQVNKHVFN